MFHVNDSISERQAQIRSLAPRVGIFLAAADFEWTLRRAILALGQCPTTSIRKELRGVAGLKKYGKI